MESSRGTASGVLGSVRILADNLLSSVQDRVELVSVELQEEKQRLIQIFIWISAAIFTGMMAIAFASFTVVFLFWETARVAALVGVTLVYTAAAIAIVMTFRRVLARQPRPFAASLQELKNDRSCIQTEN
jgi:uncharacterized membrane protein YqjE